MSILKNMAKAAASTQPPFAASNVFDEAFLSEDDLLLFFRTLTLEDIKENVIVRVYFQGKKAPSKVYELISSPPLASDSLTSWTQRLFGGDEFLILVNRCEYLLHRFSERLFVEYVKHLPNELLTDPLFKGIDLVLFIGKYQESPLGPHLDEDKISIVHLQVVGSKQFKFWKTDNCTIEPDQLLNIEEGGGITFGGLNYHSATAPVVSASLSLGVTKFSVKDLFNEASHSLIDNVKKDLYDSDVKENYPSYSQIDKILGHSLYQAPAATIYRSLFEKYLVKNRSGLYFIRPTKLKEISVVEALRNKYIQLRKPNQILFEKDGPYINLYLRKYFLKIHSTEAILSFIDALNRNERINIQDHMTLETIKLLGSMLRVDVWDYEL
jgi:hypothetical protein